MIYIHKRATPTEMNCLPTHIPETAHPEYIAHIYAQSILMHYWVFQVFSTVSFWMFQSHFWPLHCTKVTGTMLLVPTHRLENASSLAQLTTILIASHHYLMFSYSVFYIPYLSIHWLNTLFRVSVYVFSIFFKGFCLSVISTFLQ